MDEQQFPDSKPHESQPRPLGRFFDWVRSLQVVRPTDRWFAGVCSAIANRTGVDVALIRGIVVVATILGAPMVVLYVVAWALLPDSSGMSHIERIFIGRGSGTSWIVSILAVCLVFSGAWPTRSWSVPFGGFLGWNISIHWIATVGVIALIVWALVTWTPRKKRPGADAGAAGTDSSEGNSPAHGSASASAFVPNADPNVHGSASGSAKVNGTGTPSAPTASARTASARTSSAPTSGTTPDDADADHMQSDAGGFSPSFAATGTSAPTAAPLPMKVTSQRTHPRRFPAVGASGVAIILGAAMVIGAGGALLANLWPDNPLHNHPALTGVVLALVVIALATVVAAAAGRRIGAWSGWIGTLLAVIALFGTLIGGNLGSLQAIRDEHMTATQLATGQSDNVRGAIIGDQTLDLSESTDAATSLRGKTINVAGGVGDVNVIVPSNVSAIVTVRQGVGDINVQGNSRNIRNKGASGIWHSENINIEYGQIVSKFSDATSKSEAIIINIRRAVGDVEVETK